MYLLSIITIKVLHFILNIDDSKTYNGIPTILYEITVMLL